MITIYIYIYIYICARSQDIPNVAECEAARTVHRVRRSGEDRRLLVCTLC